MHCDTSFGGKLQSGMVAKGNANAYWTVLVRGDLITMRVQVHNSLQLLSAITETTLESDKKPHNVIIFMHHIILLYTMISGLRIIRE